MVQIPAEDRVRIFHTYNEADVQLEITPGGTIHNYTSIEYWSNGIGISLRMLPCKLLLNNMADITEEHALEVAKILNDQSDEGLYDANMFHEWMEEIFTGNCATYADYVSGNDFIRVCDYLRSKSYNVGYGSHSPQDLIDAGIAVYVDNKATI